MKSFKEMVRNSLSILKSNITTELEDPNVFLVWNILINESMDKIALIHVINKLKEKYSISDFEIEYLIEDAI